MNSKRRQAPNYLYTGYSARACWSVWRSKPLLACLLASGLSTCCCCCTDKMHDRSASFAACSFSSLSPNPIRHQPKFDWMAQSPFRSRPSHAQHQLSPFLQPHQNPFAAMLAASASTSFFGFPASSPATAIPSPFQMNVGSTSMTSALFYPFAAATPPAMLPAPAASTSFFGFPASLPATAIPSCFQMNVGSTSMAPASFYPLAAATPPAMLPASAASTSFFGFPASSTETVSPTSFQKNVGSMAPASYGDAPGAELGGQDSSVEQKFEVDVSESDTTATAPNSVSQSNLNYKKMKSTSKAAQFYTTIVMISCLYVKESCGYLGSYKRSCIIFRKVECGLRDRVIYPLPENVSVKELMTFSYFQGPNSENDYLLYCTRESEPLKDSMITFAERLFQNKFTEIKKYITNHVLPKFLDAVHKLTGKTNQRSGQAAYLTPHTSHLTPHTSHLTPHTSHLTLTPHTSHLTPHPSGTMRTLKKRLQRQMRCCIK